MLMRTDEQRHSYLLTQLLLACVLSSIAHGRTSSLLNSVKFLFQWHKNVMSREKLIRLYVNLMGSNG
jgi:hypothetical protein